ncbi:hypothetical protein BDW02DRAFT_626626 [Decorospora gaudefroyi]|uniref:Wings apart-like protein C-terminal domain-containing protein n=1 Tax=Decorospora gaudefroyi TaxID=184978 RepID=A0A6A5KS66_9PLEO|nr:hypothetical protein BDW02DRAFT_626626 [Decorospora gaudefroyi]
MATTIFPSFTASDGRKKVVYGKSSRLSTMPPPAPTSNEDAPPSPEQARKHATTSSNGSLKKAGGARKTDNILGGTRAKTSHVDIFDVPSDDELLLRPTKPTKQLAAKHRTPKEGLSLPAKPTAGARRTPKPAQLLKPPLAQSLSSPDPIAPRTRSGNTPQPTGVIKQTTRNGLLAQRPVAKGKASSQMTTPAPSKPKALKNANTVSAPPSKKTPAKPTAKAAEDLGVFDVPSSDEEAPSTVKKPLRNVPARKTQAPVPKPSKLLQDSRKAAESDDSNASKKRKRQGSVSSTAAIKPALEQKPHLSAPQRSRKSQKKDDSASPGQTSLDEPIGPPTQQLRSAAPAINKPRRTRLRTVPVLAPPEIAKGHSSPATLNSMLRNRQSNKPSPVAEVPETVESEDQTMYDIPDALATPVRTSKPATPGTATPRQKTLFGGLLGDSSSANTPMPSISALQLTDRKPKSLVGVLSRSKSDVMYSTQARKTRLIDTLKPVESSSQDEDEDSSSSSGRGPEDPRIHNRPIAKPSAEPRHAGLSSDDMDVEVEAAADSQTSQATSGFGLRPKLTYAMSRSYLREANPEDDLLVSMDLDESLGPASQTKDSLSEDEPDQGSQAQAYHELKSRGRNHAFEQELRTLLDDISSITNNSIRRSTMMELCTKMADRSYRSQLLDSPLAHEFFQNITAGNDVIFDFTAAVATVFILQTTPTYTILDQLQESHILTTLTRLIGNDADIQKIAKDRKTNLSKLAKESVLTFRSLVQQSSIWSCPEPAKVTPQLVALRAIELLIVGLRKAGRTEMLLSQPVVAQLVETASKSRECLDSNKDSPDAVAILRMVLSTLEAVSATRQKQSMWPIVVLQRIAQFMPVFFGPDGAASTMLAVKLCMHLTNNKPKACQPFSDKAFVHPLMLSVIEKFRLLHTGLGLEERTGVLEGLILSLGAMINLAEFSDQTRLNVDDGGQMISTLVQIFLEGSERASQADSMEESHSGVAIGYLTVLLGNLCLNNSIRSKIRALLPNQRLHTLIDGIKDFVRVHEHVDSKTEDFEGAEGQETLQTYTARLLHVVERLEKATA